MLCQSLPFQNSVDNKLILFGLKSMILKQSNYADKVNQNVQANLSCKKLNTHNARDSLLHKSEIHRI